MQTIKVREVYNPQIASATAVPEETPLEQIVTKMSEDPCLRGIFVVDSRQRFAGVITRTVLLKWAFLQFRRPVGSSRVHISRRDIYNLVLSGKAKDVARGDWRSLGVQLEDTLEEALNQMFEYEAIDIPVLDDEGRILGDLRLTEVLKEAVESAKRDNS